MMGEIKSGPCLNKKGAFFFSMAFFMSGNITSARLASSIKCHSSLVRLPAERTNVANIGAFVNRSGLVISFSSIFLHERNCFGDCFNMWSRCMFSKMSSQK